MNEIAKLSGGQFYCVECGVDKPYSTDKYNRPNLHYMTICHQCKRPVYVVAVGYFAEEALKAKAQLRRAESELVLAQKELTQVLAEQKSLLFLKLDEEQGGSYTLLTADLEACTHGVVGGCEVKCQECNLTCKKHVSTDHEFRGTEG